VPDSVLALPFYDSVAFLAACAAVTTRERLGVACMASLGLRHPLVVARQWANLDALSGGADDADRLPGRASRPGPGARAWNSELARPVTSDRIRELAAVGTPGTCAERVAELAPGRMPQVVLSFLRSRAQMG
jgi:alkanesulfonate monooxygenase SsuD/methylene tetrahydromethanopterin reductase-like flavin-dependent oxidoreductase (luciferase family)